MLALVRSVFRMQEHVIPVNCVGLESVIIHFKELSFRNKNNEPFIADGTNERSNVSVSP